MNVLHSFFPHSCARTLSLPSVRSFVRSLLIHSAAAAPPPVAAPILSPLCCSAIRSIEWTRPDVRSHNCIKSGAIKFPGDMVDIILLAGLLWSVHVQAFRANTSNPGVTAGGMCAPARGFAKGNRAIRPLQGTRSYKRSSVMVLVWGYESYLKWPTLLQSTVTDQPPRCAQPLACASIQLSSVRFVSPTMTTTRKKKEAGWTPLIPSSPRTTAVSGVCDIGKQITIKHVHVHMYIPIPMHSPRPLWMDGSFCWFVHSLVCRRPSFRKSMYNNQWQCPPQFH